MKSRRILSLAMGCLGLVLFGASCSSSSKKTTSAPLPSVQVSISAGQRFIPPTIRVKLHQTIIWRNFSTTEQTVTGDTGGPKSDVLKRLDTYRYSFEKTGTYTYHSEKKPDMKGTIIVEK